MASSLNKSRVFYVQLVAICAALLILFTRPLIALDSAAHVLLDIVGYCCVLICVVGRIYTTTFLGGYKNNTLITYGPFSTMRNPLYFFSFVGACGIGLMSGHITLMLLIPAMFYLIFQAVISREEQFLAAHFGEKYLAYQRATPRFFPKLSLLSTPESVVMYPRFLKNGVKDSFLWFASLPLLELIEHLKGLGVIISYFQLP